MKNGKPKLDLRTALEILHEANSDDESYYVEVCRNTRQKYGISDRKLCILFLIGNVGKSWYFKKY